MVIFGQGDAATLQATSEANFGGALIQVANNHGNGVNVTDDGEEGEISLLTPYGDVEDKVILEDDKTEQNQALFHSIRSMKTQTAAVLLFVFILSQPLPGEDPNTVYDPGNVAIPVVGKSIEIRRFDAPEARQGVAVDEDFIYVIGNTNIGKYDKEYPELLSTWECPEGQPLTHLNAGIVLDGLLYCAHSNYPEVPMLGSVELFDPDTLEPAGNHSFGMGIGSTTWMDRKDGSWYVCFAHYGNRAAEPNRDSRWSQLIQYDKSWRRMAGWAFPKELIPVFGNYSASGGAFGPRGYLYITGHDEMQLYVLKFPTQGSRLELVGRIPVPLHGQAFAFDPEHPNRLYGIIKATREVIELEVRLE